MTDPLPEWLRQTPNLSSLHNLPDVPWGGYNPREAQLPSLPDLFDFVGKFLEKFLERVVMAVVGFFIPGVSSFEQLQEWAQNLGAQITSFIYNTAGINLASWDDFVASLADGKGIDLPLLKAGLDFLSAIFGGLNFDDLPTPAEAWQLVADTFLGGIFAIPGDVQASINAALGDLQDALDGNYSGSGPIFVAIQALAEAWLTGSSALNAANLFGRISLPQFGSGVPIMALTTAVPNELEPFTAESVPTSDGWSFNATENAAQVIADGSTKKLYLQSGVIKVEEGQPINTTVPVKYSGVTSGSGHTIRYELETFTTEDGSGTATPVVVGFINNPSGTIGSPVTLGDTSWDIPAGVQSVRPALVLDELVTAGTVFWKNTPTLKRILAGPLAGGLPAAIQDRIDEFQQLLTDLLTNPAGVLGNLPRTLVSGLEAWWDGITAKTVNLTSGGFFDAAKLQNITGTIAQSLVTGLTGSLSDMQATLNQIGDIFDNTVVTPINGVVQAIKDWWNQWFGDGSTNAIPLSQKGAANGVATLDSAGNVPLSQLGNVPANGGEPTEHVLFTISASQSIPNGAATSITGWQQVGSVQATFDDGTNTRFTLPKAGWWDIQSQVVWASSTTGKRQSAVVRTLSSGSVIPATSGEDAADHPAWPVRNKIQDIQEVAARGSLAATDKFSVQVYQNSGAALNAVSGYPDGTYVLATYLGEREFEPFSEENVNRTNQPVPSGVAGCWVTLGGGGGGGGGGQKNTPNAYGGGGGGGGAKIFRTWIPVALLGSTYSVTRGALGNGGTGSTTRNGSAGVNGGASTFTSGSVSLSAGGGAGGGGGLSSGGVLGGAGGTASVSGVTATTAAGAAGGPGGSSAGAGVNNTAGGGGGGGGGGSATGSVSPGKGGDSVVATGTALSGADQTGDKPAAGGGGGTSRGSFHEGAAGGFGCGAGGGGGGAGGTAAGADGGYGGRGYTLIEWK